MPACWPRERRVRELYTSESTVRNNSGTLAFCQGPSNTFACRLAACVQKRERLRRWNRTKRGRGGQRVHVFECAAIIDACAHQQRYFQTGSLITRCVHALSRRATFRRPVTKRSRPQQSCSGNVFFDWKIPHRCIVGGLLWRGS